VLGLALDSAGLLASAAVWADAGGTEDGAPVASFRLLGYQDLPAEQGKADQLILAVERLLMACALGYRDLDVIAVNRGPGSFTGIRSAVALGRGLALAAALPVIGLTSHQVLAARLGFDKADDLQARPRRLMIAEDARRGQVYVQSFDADLEPEGEIRVEAPEVAARELALGPWRLLGSGAALVLASLLEPADVIMVEGSGLDARGVAIAAAARLAAGDLPKPGFDLLPLYLRPPDAVRPQPLVSRSPQSALGEA
jgi:tRNA threonylcarbamoyl adenosine modification protein YeaZ